MPFKSPSSRFVRRSDGALKSPLSYFVGHVSSRVVTHSNRPCHVSSSVMFRRHVSSRFVAQTA